MKLNKSATVTSQGSTFGTVFANGKKGVGPIVATTLLLLVAVIGFVSIQSWFASMSSDLEMKKLHEQTFDESTIDFLGIKYENSIPYLFVKSSLRIDVAVNNVTINGGSCLLIGSNGIFKNSISKIPLECVADMNSVNSLVVMTGNDIVERSVSRND